MEELRVLKKVGEIVHETLKLGVDKIHSGMPVGELCKLLEDNVIRMEGKPAFPVNVCINDIAAHYTAKVEEGLLIPNNSVVKLDVGVHVEGLIVDAAITVEVGSTQFNLLIKSAKEALRSALDAIKPGMRAFHVGSVIERTIRSYGFKPIYNLSGHRIGRYELHAGYSIPNYADKSCSQALYPGDIYAIEPFATNGRGYVLERREATIYRLVRTRKVRKELRDFVDVVYKEFRTLPFTPRWLVGRFEKGYLLKLIRDAVNEGILHAYPVLVEESSGFVSQFEDTVILAEGSAISLANTLELT